MPGLRSAHSLLDHRHKWIVSGNDQNIERSVAYMRAHLAEPITAKTLARIAHVSCSHFFVLFKRRMRKPPIEYLINLRMQEGARLLASTPMQVKDIAAALGYDDAYYFSRLFKAAYKVSPRQYRLARLQARSSSRTIALESKST